MSIYSTLWHLQFPRDGDAYADCEWVDVFGQGVPAHVGTPTPGYGYEAGDPCEAFLPPALRLEDGTTEDNLRAVVFVASTTTKGTKRSGQEYESPLLVLTGIEYAASASDSIAARCRVRSSRRRMADDDEPMASRRAGRRQRRNRRLHGSPGRVDFSSHHQLPRRGSPAAAAVILAGGGARTARAQASHEDETAANNPLTDFSIGTR